MTVVDDHEPLPEARPAPEPPPRRSRLLLVACIGLFVLSLVLGILSAVLGSRLDDEVTRRDDVEEVAGRFATALLTYDHAKLDETRDAVLALSTGKFRKEYEQAFAGGLEVLITETKATSEGTVTDVYVSDVEEDTASAIVVANVRVSGTAGDRRTAASYIQLELVRVSGAWRVDGVTNLNFGQNSGAGAVPAAPTTSTTTPPK